MTVGQSQGNGKAASSDKSLPFGIFLWRYRRTISRELMRQELGAIRENDFEAYARLRKYAEIGADGHAVGHGCARPQPRSHRARDGPGFAFTAARVPGPPSRYGTWHLSTGDGGDLIVALDPITTDPCDHRYESKGHDPGVRLRHLAQVRHATCTGPTCRRLAATCDFDHNTPFEAGRPPPPCHPPPNPPPHPPPTTPPPPYHP